ncbi:MAG: magnetochrome domain-containing protein [Thermodesulfobacteriota bacterium]
MTGTGQTGKTAGRAGLALVLVAAVLASWHGLSRLDAALSGLVTLPAPQGATGLFLDSQPATPPPRQTVIRRIPRISAAAVRLHPFWGRCDHCHLFVNGPPAGSQPKTPVGAALEGISTIIKIAPPILPSSARPHPPAGRCIKCHDIVVRW